MTPMQSVRGLLDGACATDDVMARWVVPERHAEGGQALRDPVVSFGDFRDAIAPAIGGRAG